MNGSPRQGQLLAAILYTGFRHSDLSGRKSRNGKEMNRALGHLCAHNYRLNWARRTYWGWWDDWDDTVLQTQDSKFEPWRSEAEHATSRSRRLPTILTFTRGRGRNIFCFFQTAVTGNRTPNSGVKGSGANHYPRAPALAVWARNGLYPAESKRWINVDLALVQRRRRWTNDQPTLIQRLMSDGYLPVIQTFCKCCKCFCKCFPPLF